MQNKANRKVGINKQRRIALAERACMLSQLRCFHTKKLLEIVTKEHEEPAYEFEYQKISATIEA